MKQDSFQQQLGASYVEMSISIIVFMMIIVSVLELLKFSFVTVSIQHTLQEGLEAATKSNFTATGGCNLPNSGVVVDSLNSESARATCIKTEIVKIAQRLDLTITPAMISVTRPVRPARMVNGVSQPAETAPTQAKWRCDPALPTTFGPTNAGERGEIVAICIRTNVSIFSWFQTSAQMDFIVFGRNEYFRYQSDLLGGT